MQIKIEINKLYNHSLIFSQLQVLKDKHRNQSSIYICIMFWPQMGKKDREHTMESVLERIDIEQGRLSETKENQDTAFFSSIFF